MELHVVTCTILHVLTCMGLDGIHALMGLHTIPNQS